MKFLLVSVLFSYFFSLSVINAFELPEVTVKYEVLQGSDEEEIEDYLLPSSLRNIASLRLKKIFTDELWYAVLVKYSNKDYYNTKGDYSYINLNNGLSWKISSTMKIGADFLTRYVYFNDLDTTNQPKNYINLGGKFSGTYKILPGLSLGTWIKADYNLYTNAEKSKQEYTVNVGVISKQDNLLWRLRYKGILRDALGDLSIQSRSFLNYGSISATWKP